MTTLQKRSLAAAVMAASLALALGAAACGGGKSKDGGPTPEATQPTGTATGMAASSATAAAATAVVANGSPRVQATVLANGTIVVGGGTVIAPAEATQIAVAATTPAAATPPAPPPPPPTIAPGSSPVAQPTAPPVALTPRPDDPNAAIRVEPPAITVASGQNFDITVVANPAEPYRGFQWTLHAAPPVSYVSSAGVAPGSPFETCSNPALVAEAAWYGGCITFNDPNTYAGPLSTVTYRCDGPGVAEILLLTTLEGNGFGSSLLQSGGAELGLPSGRPVRVTCT